MSSQSNKRKERFIEFMAYLIVGAGVGIIVLTAVALVARFVLIPIFIN